MGRGEPNSEAPVPCVERQTEKLCGQNDSSWFTEALKRKLGYTTVTKTTDGSLTRLYGGNRLKFYDEWLPVKWAGTSSPAEKQLLLEHKHDVVSPTSSQFKAAHEVHRQAETRSNVCT